MVCSRCNSTNIVKVKGGSFFSSKICDHIWIEDITHKRCKDCDLISIDFKEAVRVSEKIQQIHDQLILKLPIGGFISPQQAAEILGISVSTLKRTKGIIKVRRGMMFLYDKISVAKYKDTGDGYYFILNRTVKDRVKIEF